MADTLARGAEFIWNNARLLERQLLAFHFFGGSAEDVMRALVAYRNADAGFGNALEPDLRGPVSQPVPVQHALEIMDAVSWDDAIAQAACDFLATAQAPDHGVPFVLPSAHAYPRAPWWQASDPPVGSLNPTAAIAGLLHKHCVAHRWIEPASAFCWGQLDTLPMEDAHTVGVAITFLRYVPDRERAERAFEQLMRRLLASDLVAEVDATGYVRKPLDWAPTPDHPCRPYFGDAVIHANLDYVLAQQQDDGGWPITWTPPSPASEYEWRGWVTLERLLALRAIGRLD